MVRALSEVGVNPGSEVGWLVIAVFLAPNGRAGTFHFVNLVKSCRV